MITYTKKGNIFLGFFGIFGGIFLIAFHYISYGFSLDKSGILGIVGIILGIYAIKNNKGKLLIGEDSIVVDGQKIPAFSITEIEQKDKGWKITIKTVDKNIIIHMADYLIFSNKKKLKRVYNQLFELTNKKGSS